MKSTLIKATLFQFFGLILSGLLVLFSAYDTTEKAYSGFNHFFDWILLYYTGMSITLIEYLTKKYQNRRDPEEYHQQLLRAETGQGKGLVVPNVSWISLIFSEWVSLFTGVLAFMQLQPFVFLTFQSFIIFLYYFIGAKNEYQKMKYGPTLLGTVLIFLGQILIGICGGLITNQWKQISVWILLGLLFLKLNLISSTFNALCKKRLVKKYFIERSKVSFITGGICLILWIFTLIIVQFIPCDKLFEYTCPQNDSISHLENTPEFFTKTFNTHKIIYIVTFFAIIVSSVLFSIYDASISQSMSLVQKNAILQNAGGFVGLIYLWVYNEKHELALKIISIFAYISILFGSLILWKILKISADKEQIIIRHQHHIQDDSEIS